MCQAQLTELRMKVGASLSDRYLSQQRGTAKIMTEHDRLRKELMQVGKRLKSQSVRGSQYLLTYVYYIGCA